MFQVPLLVYPRYVKFILKIRGPLMSRLIGDYIIRLTEASWILFSFWKLSARTVDPVAISIAWLALTSSSSICHFLSHILSITRSMAFWTFIVYYCNAFWAVDMCASSSVTRALLLRCVERRWSACGNTACWVRTNWVGAVWHWPLVTVLQDHNSLHQFVYSVLLFISSAEHLATLLHFCFKNRFFSLSLPGFFVVLIWHWHWRAFSLDFIWARTNMRNAHFACHSARMCMPCVPYLYNLHES